MTNWSTRGDVLNRHANAIDLTDFMTGRYALRHASNSHNSYVLAMDAEWGTGKTFLLTNWKEDLENSGYPVVYFDAWANDFADKPLLGFIAEVSKSLHEQFGSAPAAQRLIKSLRNRVPALLRASGRIAIEVAVRKAIGYGVAEISERFSTAGKGSASADDVEDDARRLSEESIEALLDEHNTIRDAMAGFKSDLGALVQRIEKMASKKLPIFILVDELDRCRPDYAIELLETIKHLFGVDGVYFVVGANLRQLSHSIRAVYGEKFNAEKYLHRFFDQVYSLPQPEFERYTKHRLQEEGLHDAFNLAPSALRDAFNSQHVDVEKVCTSIFRCFKFELRDVHQVVAHAASVVAMNAETKIDFAYLTFLVSLFHFNREDFEFVTTHPTQVTDHLLRNGGTDNIDVQFDRYRKLKVLQIGETYLRSSKLNSTQLAQRRAQLRENNAEHEFEEAVLFWLQRDISYQVYPRMVSTCATILGLIS